MKEWIDKINSSESLEQLESYRIELLGKKGVLTLEFAKMKDVPNTEKKAFAQNLNKQKTEVNIALDTQKTILMAKELAIKLASEKIDVTKFSSNCTTASKHPVCDTLDRVTTYFQNLNFLISSTS